MDDFIEEGSSVDIYDFKYIINAALKYNVEDKLSNITAKTLLSGSLEDVYYPIEFDLYPIKDKIENVEINIFNAQDYVYNYDYSEFVDDLREFLEEFKK